jgi:hypothetical protein
MQVKIKYCLFTFLLVVTSCQKREWNNPFDPECPKEIFTPSGLTATQEGNQIKLLWNQKNNQITGFIISRNENNGNWAEVTKIPQSPTTYIHLSPVGGVQYGYQIVAYAGTNNSNPVQTSITALADPTVTTTAQTNVTSTSAVLGGNVTNDGGSSVTERGIVYSTSQNPTTSHSKVTIGNGTGTFSTTVTGLASNTTYYVRAYAINSQGTAYGAQENFTTTKTYSIGETGPAGGYVFYDKGYFSNGWRYLEAAPYDYSGFISTVWWNGKWTYQNAIGISPDKGLGSGKANTLLIIAANNNLNNAAKICDDYTLNGFTDWYLPSIDELQLICENLYSGKIGNFTDGFYWSSTDTNRTGNAWWIQFSGGCQLRTDSGRDMTNKVRPVRQF